MSINDIGPDSPDPTNPYAAPLTDAGPQEFEPARSVATLNPWTSIWTKPRATIRQIIETDPGYLVLPLAAAIGVASAMQNAAEQAVEAKAPAPLLVVGGVVGGLIGGLIMYVLLPWLYSVTARWLGGNATLQQMRAAYAWGSSPTIYTIPISLAIVLLSTSVDFQGPAAFAVLAAGVVEMVVGIWAFVVLCKCIGEVSGFSAWRGFGAMLLAGLLLIVPLIAIGIAVAAALA